MVIGIHVDDGIVCSSRKEVYVKFMDLQRDFVLSSHGELEWYLECKIVQDLTVSTPFESGLHLNGDDYLSKDKRDPEVVRDYQVCVGSLMYLSVGWTTHLLSIRRYAF